jgi:hypothetical protein
MATIINPTTPATFYAFDDSLVSVPLVTLAVWVAGVKIAAKMGEETNLTKVVRKKLKTPKGYPLEDILDHLEKCKAETHEYYGVA